MHIRSRKNTEGKNLMLTYVVVLLLLVPPTLAVICMCIWTQWQKKVDDAKLKREVSRSLEKRRPIPVIRPSISCAPERIRPPAEPKGICGLPGCKIAWRHSHVMDLAARLKEEKK